MSKQPVVKPKTTSNTGPYSVSKDEAHARSLQETSTDKDEEYARQLQEELLREQEEMDADLARRLHEEEQNKQTPSVFRPARGRPMSATPLRQIFQTMLGLRPEVEEEDNENGTPAMDPNSPDAASTAAAATGIFAPRGIIGATGVAGGRGEGRGLPGRRAAGRSPERARRGGLNRSPERPMRGRGIRRASSDSGNNAENETPSEPQNTTVDQLPGVRPNPAFRPRRVRRIVLHNTNPPEETDNPQPNVRPIGAALRPLLGEREATMNLPDNEYDPDFMVLDLGAQENQREANFINMMRDPFLLMLLLMGRDPGFMVPDDVDLGDYEALWELAERLGEVRGRGMKEEEINKLPYRTYRRKAGKTDESCSICMSEYKTAENVQILPCQHEYHKGCLLEWLKRNATCPICRQDVKKNT